MAWATMPTLGVRQAVEISERAVGFSSSMIRRARSAAIVVRHSRLVDQLPLPLYDRELQTAGFLIGSVRRVYSSRCSADGELTGS